MVSNFELLKTIMFTSSLLLVAFSILTLFDEPNKEGDVTRVVKDIDDGSVLVYATPMPDTISLFPTSRHNKTTRISLIIVYTNGTSLDNYATALNIVECYAKLHSYPFYLFSDAKYNECAKHKDLFFRRHCNIAHFMGSELSHNSWLLAVDADIAVVNPSILIEKFIDPNYEITLFDRFFNYEVGANSYLVKNTELGRAFVHKFAEYEFKLPNSFHGTDNGALHPYLAELLAPENGRIVNSLCAKIWRTSKNYGSLYEMEACNRLIFGDRTHFPDQKLRILPKGKAWVRDLWLLKSRWAEDDFMVHAVKEKELEKLRPEIKNVSDSDLYQWDPTEGKKKTFPLLNKLNISRCESGQEQWLYDTRLMISSEKKAELLKTMEETIFKKRLKTIGRLAGGL